MHLNFDLQRLAPVAVIVALAAAALFLVGRGAISGGDGSGGESAQQAFEQAFAGSGKEPQSGKLKGSATISVNAPGAAASGPVSMRFEGALDGSDRAAPKFDLEIKVDGGGESATMGIVSTGSRAFVEIDGTAYELPASQVRRLSGQTGEKSSDQAAALASLGIDPRTWVTEVTDAGSADVGGEPVRHVTAELDTARMLQDMLRAAERTGQADQIPAQARTMLEDSVKGATLDAYVSKQDGSLRKLAMVAKVEIANPAGGDPISGDARFELELTEVGKPQEIDAPEDARPFSEAPGGLGLGDLQSGLGGLGADGGPSAQRAGDATDGGSAQAGSSPGNGSATRDGQAYVSCVQKAQDLAALEKCQSLLP